MSLSSVDRMQQAITSMWKSTGISSEAIEETIRLSPRHSPLGAANRGMSPRRGGKRAAGGEGRHVLFSHGNDLAECLAFTMAVQEFKELWRHDLTTTEKKWEVAQRIFDEFLRGRTVVSPATQSCLWSVFDDMSETFLMLHMVMTLSGASTRRGGGGARSRGLY